MTQTTLKACWRIDKEIEGIEERILRLQSNAEKTTTRLSASRSGRGTRDVMADYAAELDKLERERVRLIILREKAADKIENWLSTLPDQQARVMRYKYISGMKWRQVAKASDYSERHCKRIHKVALKKCR